MQTLKTAYSKKQQLHKKKLVSMRNLRKKAWQTFSLWIRNRDKGVCFTCGMKKPIKEMQAGHFIHRNALDFDEYNINCQCKQCNIMKSGNLSIYAIKLEAKYGHGILQILEDKSNQIAKFSRSDLENIITKYS